jgi:hypothetical protein
MKNRAILSREGAKKVPVKKEKKAPVKKVKKEIRMIDPESEEVLATFASLEEAIEEKGLNRPNLIGAIKNGNKYKGSLWQEVSEQV